MSWTKGANENVLFNVAFQSLSDSVVVLGKDKTRLSSGPVCFWCRQCSSCQCWNWAAMLGVNSAAALWAKVKWPALASGLLNKAVVRGQSAQCEWGSFLPHGDNGPHILYTGEGDGKEFHTENLDNKHSHWASIAAPDHTLTLWTSHLMMATQVLHIWLVNESNTGHRVSWLLRV